MGIVEREMYENHCLVHEEMREVEPRERFVLSRHGFESALARRESKHRKSYRYNSSYFTMLELLLRTRAS